MHPSGKQLIGYSDSQQGTRFFDTLNPATLEKNGFSFAVATRDELNEAALKAESAFQTFALSSNELRANFLRLISTKLEENRTELCEIYCKESGLPNDRAHIELNRTIFQLHEFSDLISEYNCH
jgi:alpha-ketoglutaric semialdehyde dehydrogenase